MKFPREVWAGSMRKGAREPSRIVVEDEEEYQDFVKKYNGKMNVFTSVYDYREFTHNRGLEQSAILDRIFLDIDAHGDANLNEAYEVTQKLHQWLYDQNYKHSMAFSGRGFHIIVKGKTTTNIRKIKAFFNICHDVVNKSNYLDPVVINTSRLRRVRNSYHLKAERYCIPLNPFDLVCDNIMGLQRILEMSNKSRNLDKYWYGDELVEWPDVQQIQVAEIEIDYVESPGSIPILPCLKNSIMTENPIHRTRYLLVQWYNEILSDLAITSNGLNVLPRQLTGNVLNNIKTEIENEIETIASNEDVWLDYDPIITRDQVGFIVDKRYMAPSCDTLINEGYCIGKCWRYNGAGTDSSN